MGLKMYFRVEVGFKSEATDTCGMNKTREIKDFLKIRVRSVRTKNVYTIDAKLSALELNLIKNELLVDPIIEESDILH